MAKKEALLCSLTGCGIGRANEALRRNGGDANAAADWIFNNPTTLNLNDLEGRGDGGGGDEPPPEGAAAGATTSDPPDIVVPPSGSFDSASSAVPPPEFEMRLERGAKATD